jgi:hypothetical protein
LKYEREGEGVPALVAYRVIIAHRRTLMQFEQAEP